MEPMRSMRPLTAIFVTILIDMLGFAMFIPDLQLRGETIGRAAFGESGVGWFIGISLATYSIAQLITSPILGRLSDSKGRRIVLLLSTALSAISYVIYAHAHAPAAILTSRALSGIAAANIGVAFAYVADTTAPEDRAKSLGLMGMAFGLGFILGPPIGAQLLQAGKDDPMLLGYTSAVLSTINFLFVLRWVPESLKPDRVVSERHPIADLKHAMMTPGLGVLLSIFFMVNLGFTNLETTFFRLLEEPSWIFHLKEPKQAGAMILAAVGVVGAFTQGFLIRKLQPKFGELKLLRYSYLVFVPMLALVPFAQLWIPMLMGVACLGVAQGLAVPSLNSMISRRAPGTMQGGIFGITQGLGAFARVLGPLMSGPLFSWRPYAPYLAGALLAFGPAVAMWTVVRPLETQPEAA